MTQDMSRWVFWYDDMESGDNGWTHGDWTATGDPPRFHVDSYMAYGGSGSSWWCGSFDYDADGGYGNSWYEYLDIPATDVSSSGAYAVLTFAFRYDSEPTYDFTFIQAESLGAWKDLESFDGYGAWYDFGQYGYLVGSYDSPLHARFLFSSDGAYSDADGDYLSVGGGFACDNVKLFDFYNSTVFFYDDAESGGLCVAGHPGASGDYWHRRYDDCSSYSGHYSWWCGDDADTSLVPGLLQNWLDSPWIDISEAWSCKLRSAVHFEVPTVDNDYIARWVTYDGVNYYQLNASWGDFGDVRRLVRRVLDDRQAARPPDSLAAEPGSGLPRLLHDRERLRPGCRWWCRHHDRRHMARGRTGRTQSGRIEQLGQHQGDVQVAGRAPWSDLLSCSPC